jgi:hypothetical protein
VISGVAIMPSNFSMIISFNGRLISFSPWFFLHLQLKVMCYAPSSLELIGVCEDYAACFWLGSCSILLGDEVIGC